MLLVIVRKGEKLMDVEYRWGWTERFSVSSIASKVILFLLFVVCKCVHVLGGDRYGHR